MDVRNGYKITEVGVIPEDWEAVQLGSLGEALIGLTYTPSQVNSHGTLVLRSSNIQEGRLSFDDNVFVQMDLPARTITREGDLLICVRNGSRQLIGKCVLIDRDCAGSAFGAFMSIFRSDSNRYLAYMMQADLVKRQIDEMLGATINQITSANLVRFKIPLPPTKTEQEAIAGALSDADAVIEAMRQLIAKKRQIKVGAMHELLAGQRRLPGFTTRRGSKQSEVGKLPEDWEVSTVGNLAAAGSGTTPARACFERYYGNGSIPWVKTLDLNNSDIVATDEQVTETALRETSLQVYPVGTVLVAMYGGFNQIGRTGILRLPATVNQAITAIRTRRDLLSAEYLICVLNWRVGYWRSVASSSRKDPNITGKEIRGFPLAVPALAEQEAIASVLSDMDAELTALETKLVKARQVKQGMMQELLTGKVRLV